MRESDVSGLQCDFAAGFWFVLFSACVFVGLMVISYIALLIIRLAEKNKRELRELQNLCSHDQIVLKNKRNVQPYACAVCGQRF